MSFLKNAAVIAAMAGVGVAGSAGAACAQVASGNNNEFGDNGVNQGGLVSINTLQNVNISPNFGCALDQSFRDVTAQGLVGLIPVGVNLNHLLEHTSLNLLANGNSTTEVTDNSCTSNEGSSQAGNNSRGSVGAGDSSSVHSTGTDAGSHEAVSHDGSGVDGPDLMHATGLLGQG